FAAFRALAADLREHAISREETFRRIAGVKERIERDLDLRGLSLAMDDLRGIAWQHGRGPGAPRGVPAARPSPSESSPPARPPPPPGPCPATTTAEGRKVPPAAGHERAPRVL